MFFLISKVRISVAFTKKGKDNLISITVGWGLIRYVYQIPRVDANEKGVKFYKKRKKRHDGKKDSVVIRYGKVRLAYLKNKEKFRVLQKYLQYRLAIPEYSLKVGVGTEDAAITGIITGMLWALIGMADALVSHTFHIGKKSVNVQPDFSKDVLDINFRCIFQMKIVHIIGVAFVYYKTFRMK